MFLSLNPDALPCQNALSINIFLIILEASRISFADFATQ
ncbi:hypothetical protein ykris0001_2970 [Yersinia kristensenii ATCC 33638]|nr:hypothetical protein ykris0001_2970 [Yersinia kristensenii ATCC 33638]